MLKAASRFAMWLSVLAGVFLAFGWPFLPGADPSSETFHVFAVGTLIALLASITATLAAKR
jgi:hypothetical protein